MALMPAAWFRTLAKALKPHPGGAWLAQMIKDHAAELAAAFPGEALTEETARLCAGKFTAPPDYPALAAALRLSIPALTPTSAMGTSAEARDADRWDAYAARSLAAGKPRGLILDMVRKHANLQLHWVRQIMQRHFPEELAIEDAEAAEKAHEEQLRARLAHDAKGDAYIPGVAKGFKPPRPPSSNCFKPAPGQPQRPTFKDVTLGEEHLGRYRKQGTNRK
jgi:hypothetical protein